MKPILDFGITVILALQGLGSWLVPIMQFFTFLGSEEFFLLVAPAFYWCISTTVGMRMAIILMLNSWLNHVFKLIFHAPRPFWYDLRVKPLSIETSFGIPSGHSQNAAAVWGAIAAWIKKPWAWIAAGFIAFLIGFSRVVLAMHFPTDVLLGWAFGAALLWAVLTLEKPAVRWFQGLTLPGKYMAAFAGSLLMVAGVAFQTFTLSAWTMPQNWITTALATTLEEAGRPTPLALSGPISYAGVLFGIIAGAMMKTGFDVGGPWWKRLLRYGVGVIGVLLIWRGLDMIFPDGETIVAYVFRYVRYGLIGFWISGLGPWLFVRFRLSGPSPEPAITPAASLA